MRPQNASERESGIRGCGSGDERALWNRQQEDPTAGVSPLLNRVVRVTPLPRYRLQVEFDDGVTGVIDLAGELTGPVFGPLRDEALFRQVTVDDFGALYSGLGFEPSPCLGGRAYCRVETGKGVTVLS